MSAQFRLKGERQLAAELSRIAGNVPRAIDGALFRLGQQIMTISKKKHVPVARDGGTLKGTGTVERPERKGGVSTVKLTYGGPAAPYAEAIHNHPSGASPPSWKGKKLKFHLGGDRRKYLQRPLLAAVPTAARDMAEDLRVRRLVRR